MARVYNFSADEFGKLLDKLEKIDPKEPIAEYFPNANKEKTLCCPSCGKPLSNVDKDKRTGDPYCQWCGQAIKWDGDEYDDEDCLD